MVEYLPSIHEALDSTQRTKEREGERKNRENNESLNKPKHVPGVWRDVTAAKSTCYSPEDLGSVPSNHTAVHNCLWPQLQQIWCCLVASAGTRHVHKHQYRQNIHTHKLKFKSSIKKSLIVSVPTVNTSELSSSINPSLWLCLPSSTLSRAHSTYQQWRTSLWTGNVIHSLSKQQHFHKQTREKGDIGRKETI